MHRALNFRKTNFFLALVIALSTLAGPGYGQTRPAPGSSPYTATVNCPDASTLVVDITPNTLPAGWTPAHPQLELTVVEAVPSQSPPGKQLLACHYRAKVCAGCAGGADALVLKRTVELDSCVNSVPGQPKRTFLCKPDTVK
jgi:hypothetical protein